MPRPWLTVSSDNHLKEFNWVRYPTLAFDSFYSFEQIVKKTIELTTPLLLAGDIFDTKNPGPVTFGFACDQFNKLMDEQLEVYYVEGQHERNVSRSWLSCHRWPQHLHKQLVQLPNAYMYGLNYMPKDLLAPELASVPDMAVILVGHQVWLERMGEKANPEAAFADVPGQVQLLITGDFHGHRIDRFENKAGLGMTVASPGSTYMKTLDEDPKKYFFVLYDDLSLKSFPIETRPVVRSRVMTVRQLDDLILQLVEMKFTVGDERIAKPIWHVEYVSDIPQIQERLESAAENRAHLFLRLKRSISETMTDPADEEMTLDVDGRLETHLPSVTSPTGPAYNTALRLLRSNDVKKTLDELTQEALTGPDFVDEEGGF